MKRVALVLPLVLVAACGGGSSGSSKSDYLAKAEAICKDANAQVKKLTLPSDPAGFQRLVEKTLSIAESTTSKLKKLDPPSADKDEIKKKVITPLENQLAEARPYLDEVRKAVAKNDQNALGRLLQNPPREHKADLDFMKTYGFKECVTTAKTD
jgi:hypothetical protein